MTERMTIEEIIDHCKRKTEMYEKGVPADYFDVTPMTNSVKKYWEYKQIAEYLEELLKYRKLEEQGKTPKWIPVESGMPEEKDSIFAKFKGTEKWKRGMFEKRSANVIVTVKSGEETRFCMEARTIDGRWSAEDPLLREWKIIAWRKFPEPYKEKDNELG